MRKPIICNGLKAITPYKQHTGVEETIDIKPLEKSISFEVEKDEENVEP